MINFICTEWMNVQSEKGSKILVCAKLMSQRNRKGPWLLNCQDNVKNKNAAGTYHWLEYSNALLANMDPKTRTHKYLLFPLAILYYSCNPILYPPSTLVVLCTPEHSFVIIITIQISITTIVFVLLSSFGKPLALSLYSPQTIMVSISWNVKNYSYL